MNTTSNRPSARELVELTAYLAARERGLQPAPGEPGFPSGLAGHLLQMADSMQPDPAFAGRLELQLGQVHNSEAKASHPGWLSALWQSFQQPERRFAMKTIMPVAAIAILLFAILWVSLPIIFPSPTQTQLALNTPATDTLVPQGTQPVETPAPSPISPLTPSAVPPTSRPGVAILFTPQPLPSQPPVLPPLVKALGEGYGGSGAGNLKQTLPLTLATQLPAGPSEVTAYYSLEGNPLTLDEAIHIAGTWSLSPNLYMPAWMQSITPQQAERSYVAVEGMQNLWMWNNELSYTDLSIFPIFGGHQYPLAGLPPAVQATRTAESFLTQRGLLNYPYQVSLDNYRYGWVDFYRLLDSLPLSEASASVRVDPQSQAGAARVSRAEYQSAGTYPVVSAQSAWEMLSAGQPTDRMSISYHPRQDGNPQYWGRVYPAGQTAHLFGSPTYLLPAETVADPLIQLNNLVLVGDTRALLDSLKTSAGYIHAWGVVQDVNGTSQLQLSGWEPVDEFSTNFDGTIRRTAEGASLELKDGTQLKLPDLPADVPADTPIYAQGGVVGDALEWFILQVHPSTEGQTPPDLSQAQGMIDKVELVYLSPALSSLPPELALDPAYRMLIPAWHFTGTISHTGGEDLAYSAYVQASSNP